MILQDLLSFFFSRNVWSPIVLCKSVLLGINFLRDPVMGFRAFAFFFFSLINKDCWSKVFQNMKGQKTKCHSKARNKTFAYLRHWFSWCNIYIFNLVSSRSPTLTHWRQNVRLIELIKKGSDFSVEYLLMIE